TWRRFKACNKGHDGFCGLAFDPLCRNLFCFSANLANQQDGMGVRILFKQLEHIDEACAIEWIAPNSHASRLTKTKLCHLPDSFIRQRSRTRNDSHMSFSMDIPRHNAHLALARRNGARTVWAN